MGLQSALSTALTGLTAAETSIDVAGNNVANANTVGFKESKVSFATQFLQTQSIGSAPTDGRGGTNPRQIGLGVKVAEISPEFTQGTVQISANPLDTAIQGDGFFIVQGSQGETLYTRNGQFKTNANNEIVTINGQRVLGYTVDGNFALQETEVVPLTIKADSSVAQATQNVFFTGSLLPDPDEVGTDSGIIDSVVLSDGTKEVPADTVDPPTSLPRPVDGTLTAQSATGGAIEAGEYSYRITYIDANGYESPASNATAEFTIGSGTANSVALTAIPQPPGGSSSPFTDIRIYRANSTGVTANQAYRQVGQIDIATAGDPTIFTDTAADSAIAGATALNDTGLSSFSYEYYVTFYDSSNPAVESRPTAKIGPVTADATTNPRVLLQDLPRPSDNPLTGGYDSIRIYRNSLGAPGEFRRVTSFTPPATGTINYVDGTPDATIATAAEVNLNGPPIDATTPITELVTLQGSTYVSLFDVPVGQTAELSFTSNKGGRQLATRSMTVSGTTNVGQLLQFMSRTMGIVDANVPQEDTFPDAEGGVYGGKVNGAESKLQFVSNKGIENELSVGLSAFQLELQDGTVNNVGLQFSSSQDANGRGATADVIVFDSLGSPLRVRVTTVLEATDTGEATFRWIATSDDNHSISDPARTLLGTGVIKTDGQGKLVSQDNNEVALLREGLPPNNPLVFDLDFSSVTGLDQGDNSLSAARQDGFPAGTLSSFIITETGRIQGVFSNGSTRDLGQILMAKFINNAGLEQKGDNLFAAGVNSGLPTVDEPGKQGIGSITSGAVELSTTDIGQNLIELITASTQYRGGARVITAVQQLLDELLNLRR